jgi:hypothetical protein
MKTRKQESVSCIPASVECLAGVLGYFSSSSAISTALSAAPLSN